MRCLAVPVIGAPTMAALSVSGPGRMTLDLRGDAVPVMQAVATDVAKALTEGDRLSRGA